MKFEAFEVLESNGFNILKFVKRTNISKHAKHCNNGETKIECPGRLVIASRSSFEKAFFPKSVFGKRAIAWIKHEAREHEKHIHHHRCGHGGERVIDRAPVDGFEPVSKTVFQIHGCHFHGCPQCFPGERQNEILFTDKKGQPVTRAEKYAQTLK